MFPVLASVLALAATACAQGGYGDVCSGANGNAATFNFAIGDIPAKIIVDTVRIPHYIPARHRTAQARTGTGLAQARTNAMATASAGVR